MNVIIIIPGVLLFLTTEMSWHNMEDSSRYRCGT